MISFKTLSHQEENDEYLLVILKKLTDLNKENKIFYYLNSNICIAIAYYHGIEIKINEFDIHILYQKNKAETVLSQSFLQKYENESKQFYESIKNKIKNDNQNDFKKIIEILT